MCLTLTYLFTSESFEDVSMYGGFGVESIQSTTKDVFIGMKAVS